VGTRNKDAQSAVEGRPERGRASIAVTGRWEPPAFGDSTHSAAAERGSMRPPPEAPCAAAARPARSCERGLSAARREWAGTRTPAATRACTRALLLAGLLAARTPHPARASAEVPPPECGADLARVQARGRGTGDLFEELRPDYAFEHVAAGAGQHVQFAQAHPRCFNALFNAAAALQGQMQQAAAAAFWRRALELQDPHVGPEAEAEAEYQLAVTLHSLGDEAGAIGCLLRAIGRRPTHSRAWLRLGLVLHGAHGQGPLTAARAMLAALRIQRGRAVPEHLRRGSAEDEGSRADEVLYYILQETLRQGGQDERAGEIAREAVRKHPLSPELFCRMFVVAVRTSVHAAAMSRRCMIAPHATAILAAYIRQCASVCAWAWLRVYRHG